MDTIWSKDISDYQIISTLGSGNYGTVFLVKYKDKEYALKQFKFGEKILHYKSPILNNNGMTRQEIDALLRIRHPNIIKGYQMVPEYKMENGLNMLNLNLVMELGDYNLNSSIMPVIDNKTKIRYMFEFLSGMKFLYDLGYLHCDLKSENILISNGTLKIADLGLLSNKYTLPIFMKHNVFCNSLSTRAPELMQKYYDIHTFINKLPRETSVEVESWISIYRKKFYSILSKDFVPVMTYVKSEFYSMGRVLLELCLSRDIRDLKDSLEMTFRIPLLSLEERAQIIRSLPGWPSDLIGPDFLISSLLDGDPNERLTSFDTMLKFSFLK